MSDITITSSNSMSSVAKQAYVANTQTTKADNTVADDVKKQNIQAVKDNSYSNKDNTESKSTRTSDLDEVVKETAKKLNEEKKLSKYMQEHNEKVAQERKNDLNRQNIGLAFSIDKDTENTVVQVTDLNTEKLVRQIPSEDFLKLAERLKDMRDNTAVSKKDAETKESLLVLTKLVYETNKYLLDILAIDVPDKI